MKLVDRRLIGKDGILMSDLISRQAAIELVRDVCDAIMSGCDSYYDSETDDEVYKDLLEVDAILKCNKEIRIALRNMPSAESERKKGKWTYHTYMPHKKYCSACGHDSPYDRMWEYCPHCGSYNGGEQDG